MVTPVIEEEVQEVAIPLSAMLEAPDDDAVTDDKSVTEDATSVKDAVTAVEEKIEDAKEDGATAAELSELRGLLRQLRNDNIDLKAKLSAVERVQSGEFGKEGTDVKQTELEQYREQLSEAVSRDFSQIIAVMEVNPKYEDLETVCTQENFDDIFERVAKYRTGQNGTDFDVELLKAKYEVWALPNPYKYMYETIKQYNPKFATVKTAAAEEAKPKAKTPVTTPTSVATMGSGDEAQGGWTAERIDNMPESKLHEVPKAVYSKWLCGELD